MGAYSDLGLQQSKSIQDYLSEFDQLSKTRRADLTSRLADLGQQTFNRANPGILEDLNSRGLATSATAVGGEQSRVLGDIARGNDASLLNYDTQNNQYMDKLREDAINAQYAGAGNELQANLANELAARSSRDALTGSLIGAGSNLGGVFLQGQMLKNILGRGAAGAGGGAGVSAGAGVPSVVGAGSIPGAEAAAGGGMFSGVGSLLPAGLGVGAGLALNNALAKGSFGKVGNKIATVAAPITTGVAKAGKTLKKIFCFWPGTEIDMADGSKMRIDDVALDDETKGGKVYSIRIAMMPDEAFYRYKGGTVVTAEHAVFEDGRWIRIKDSKCASKIPGFGGTVVSICTENHRIYANGNTFADESETDMYENLTIEQSLDCLNEAVLAGA